MESISLEELLQRYWKGSDVQEESAVLTKVNRTREREIGLRKRLSPQVVRRLDSVFARSNTVHPDSGHALYAICRACEAVNVFETGTYWGFSTAYLASALKERNAGKVYTFDINPHAGKHIPADLMSHVVLHRDRPSTQAMPDVLRTITPDLFFQDSMHDYDGVKQELEVVAPHLKPLAVVLFHDYVNEPVRQAARDVLKGYAHYLLENDDPQQIGIAINENSG